MKYVIDCQYEFDSDQLVKEYHEFKRVYRPADRDGQWNLRVTNDIQGVRAFNYGAGSLYDKHDNGWAEEREWVATNELIGEYTKQVINEIIQYAKPNKIGRVRYMAMAPKSCLTFHTDLEDVCRYHVPLIRDDGAMFINENTVSFMPAVGTLYRYDSTSRHTAINASRNVRVHLVASVYK